MTIFLVHRFVSAFYSLFGFEGTINLILSIGAIASVFFVAHSLKPYISLLVCFSFCKRLSLSYAVGVVICRRANRMERQTGETLNDIELEEVNT